LKEPKTKAGSSVLVVDGLDEAGTAAAAAAGAVGLDDGSELFVSVDELELEVALTAAGFSSSCCEDEASL
jgi:hypothetical protein